MKVRVANAPVSWGVDFADAASNPRWPRVLDEIALAGYRWIELGPIGYLPGEPSVLRAELESRDLRVAGSFVFEPFHDPRELPRILDVTRRVCRLLAAVGASHLVIIDLLVPERMRVAGRADAARRLDGAEHRRLAAAVAAVAGVAHDYGLLPVVHPHVGTYVEFRDEIERLLCQLEPELAGLCVDTGHAAYAGIDPVELYESHAERVSYLHLKDVAPGVLSRGRDFESAVADGVFCPLGRGVVDFAALARALARHGFDGWATVEQDCDPDRARDPAADARDSLAFLREAGIAGEPTDTVKARAG